MSLKERVAFITGASGGIGREICLALAKEGVKVVLFGGTKEDKLTDTAKMLEEFGGALGVYAGDLTDDKTLDVLFKKAIKEIGKIDILINNAGMAFNCDFEKTETAILDKIMNINFRSPYLLTQKALPYVKQSDRASIINIASVVAHNGYPQQSAYVASKHALLGFTKSLATEVYKDGVRVHAICPGGVYTDMIKIARPDLTGEGMIMPSEIADIVMFLLKNRGNAVIDEICVHRVNKQPFLT